MFLYQEIIRAKIYRCASDETDFDRADKTYVGSIFIAWKECVEREQNGTSEWLSFEEELRDPEGDCTVGIGGMFVGQVKWIKAGHAESGFNADGTKRAAPKAQKTTEDFRGKKVGAAGTLSLNPKEYVHPSDLALDKGYQIKFEL